MSLDIYTGMLKMMNDFTNNPTHMSASRPMFTPNFTYDHTHPKLIELRDSYNLSEIAGNKEELSRTINLLNWLSSNTFHNSDFDNSIPFNAIDLLEYTFKQPFEKGVNCRALAKILTECCLSIGIKARTVYIMPFNPYDEDNHVVTIAFIHELNKWIMLDPSYNAYMMDEENNILSPWEAREILSEQGHVKLCEEYNYNGDYTGEKYGEDHDYYIEYIAKDLFWFFCSEKNTFGAEPGGVGEMLAVVPAGYDVKKFFISNIEYRMKKYGESDELKAWLDNTKKEETVHITLADFASL